MIAPKIARTTSSTKVAGENVEGCAWSGVWSSDSALTSFIYLSPRADVHGMARPCRGTPEAYRLCSAHAIRWSDLGGSKESWILRLGSHCLTRYRHGRRSTGSNTGAACGPPSTVALSVTRSQSPSGNPTTVRIELQVFGDPFLARLALMAGRPCPMQKRTGLTLSTLRADISPLNARAIRECETSRAAKWGGMGNDTYVAIAPSRPDDGRGDLACRHRRARHDPTAETQADRREDPRWADHRRAGMGKSGGAGDPLHSRFFAEPSLMDAADRQRAR